LIIYDKAVAGRLEKIFHEDLKYAKRLTYEAWRARPLKEKILELFTIPIKEQL
jgi:cardiolipin synthase